MAVGDVASGEEKTLQTCRPPPGIKTSERDCGRQTMKKNTSEKLFK